MDKKFIQARYKDTLDDEATSNITRRAAVIAEMIPSTGLLLDVGCWDGSVARAYAGKFLEHPGSEIHGVDIVRHPRALEFYRTVVEADISREPIPVPSDHFDCVVISEVIEHVFDTDLLIGEAHRVLKAGGILVITAPNLASLVNRILLGFGYQPLCTEVSSRRTTYGNPWRREGKPAGHIRDFTMKALVDLVQAHGFRVLRRVGIPIVVRRPFATLERLAGILSPGLGGNSILQCRKTVQGERP